MYKIAYVCSSLWRSGPVNVLYNLISNFSKDEVEVTIITLSQEFPDSRILDFKKLGINIKCIGLSHSVGSLLKAEKLKDYLNEIKPDVCHTFGYRADLLISRSIKKKYPVISSLYNYPYDDYPMHYGLVKGKLMALFHINALKKFKKIIVCSNFIAQKLSVHGVNKMTRIYTGVDSKYFTPPDFNKKSTDKITFGIGENKLVFVFVGVLIKRKDPLTLVRSFAKFNKTYPILGNSTHLIILGDGPLMDNCKSIYNNSNITFLGNQPDTRPYLRISDIYVSTSLSEGFPTAVLEALAIGLPCLLSNIPPHKEMIGGMRSPMFFEKENINDLCNSFKMATNIKLIDAQKEACEYFTENYSAEIMKNNHLKEYKILYDERNTI